MKSALEFLVAAKRCEIHGLDQLGVTSQLVGSIGRLVHLLQKERGASNIFLGSAGARFGEQRQRRAAESVEVEAAVRARFDELETDSGRLSGGVRLFSRIAYVLHGLDALPELRARIAKLALPPAQATAAFTELIAGLLAVVFEAADTASDPVISRALVALFNFMQGKELAGQERATGATAFAGGRADATLQQRQLHLIEAQDRCFQIFSDFTEGDILAYWRTVEACGEMAELERLRRVLCTAPAGGPLDPELSDAWYDCCTRRIDGMKAVEDKLAASLQSLCAAKSAEAHADLNDQKAFLDSLSAGVPTPAASFAVFFDKPLNGEAPQALIAADGFGPQLERSILDMVQAQSRRLQAMSDELNAVRGALNERKVIERAKGLLMAHKGMTEDQAYKLLRQTAMSQNRRLVEVAEATLSLADFLPGARSGRVV